MRLRRRASGSLCFSDLDEAGRIVRIADFWPDPYGPPAGRAHLAGRY